MARDPQPELASPASDSLAGNIDAAFQPHRLDLTQTQIETDVQLDRVSDDLGREALAFVADRRLGLALRLC